MSLETGFKRSSFDKLFLSRCVTAHKRETRRGKEDLKVQSYGGSGKRPMPFKGPFKI